MKSLVLAAGLLVLGASTASAQYWGERQYRDYDGLRYRESYRSSNPYRGCEPEASRVHRYYYRAQRYDGRIDPGEQEVLRQLQRDFDRCRASFERRRWR